MSPEDFLKIKQFINQMISSTSLIEEDPEYQIDPISFLMNYRTIEVKTPKKFDSAFYITDVLNYDQESIVIVINDTIRDWMINTYPINPEQIFTRDEFIENGDTVLGNKSGSVYIDKTVYESSSCIDKGIIYAMISTIFGLDTMIMVI